MSGLPIDGFKKRRKKKRCEVDFELTFNPDIIIYMTLHY